MKTIASRHLKTAANKSTCQYMPTGRRHAPYAAPAAGEVRRKLLAKLQAIALELYPGAGRIVLETVPYSPADAARQTLDILLADRAPHVKPGTVGALASRILRDVIEPKQETAGSSEQRRWQTLDLLFRELVNWFASFPADDLTLEDLAVFVSAQGVWHRRLFSRYLADTCELFRDAGLTLATA